MDGNVQQNAETGLRHDCDSTRSYVLAWAHAPIPSAPQMSRTPPITPSATPAEAAAVMAAIAQHQRDTASPAAAPQGPSHSPWLRAALLEASGREPNAPSPWGDPVPWG